jgi:release factor glutamine methyltransferase
MSTVGEVVSGYHNRLSILYEKNEAEKITSMVFEHVIGFNRLDMTLKSTESIAQKHEEQFNRILKELETGKPVQYILGDTWFHGLKLHVNKHVLIPRRETEELVDWIISESNRPPETIIDFCTGSGCIALALKKAFPAARVIAVDISHDALEIAGANAISNSLAIEFIEADILNYSLEMSADLVVSNPPYVLNAEQEKMNAGVLEFEPGLALFVSENDPLIFYRRISEWALLNMKPGGKIYFEINEMMGKEISDLHSQFGFKEYTLKRDLQEKERFFKAVIPGVNSI